LATFGESVNGFITFLLHNLGMYIHCSALKCICIQTCMYCGMASGHHKLLISIATKIE